MFFINQPRKQKDAAEDLFMEHRPFGYQTWMIRAADRERLKAFEMQCYKRMLKSTWAERINNEEVSDRIREKRTFRKSLLKKELR